MQIVSCLCRKGCSGLLSGKKDGLHYPGACSREMGNYGNQLKANTTVLIQTLNNFEIKIMSSFKKMEPGSKQVFYIYFAFVQSNAIIQYILYMQICNICKYVT